MASATYNRGVETVGLDKLIEAIKAMGVRYTPGDGFGWEITKLTEYRDAFFDSCPVQPGDRVRLKRTHPKDTLAPGWQSNYPCFFAGSRATVQHIDWSRGRFLAAVIFDCEVREGAGMLGRGEYGPAKVWIRTGEKRHYFMTNADWWALSAPTQEEKS